MRISFRRKTFQVNMVLLHLAVEQAIAEAMKQEVERQFCEQYPGWQLDLRDCHADFPDFSNIDLNVPGYDIEWVQP